LSLNYIVILTIFVLVTKIALL